VHKTKRQAITQTFVSHIYYVYKTKEIKKERQQKTEKMNEN